MNWDFDDIERYKDYIFHSLVSHLKSKQEENDQPIIDDLMEIIDLTTYAYLETNTLQLYKLSSLEKQTKLKSINITEEIRDDLRET